MSRLSTPAERPDAPPPPRPSWLRRVRDGEPAALLQVGGTIVAALITAAASVLTVVLANDHQPAATPTQTRYSASPARTPLAPSAGSTPVTVGVQLYPEKTLTVKLDGCDRGDDLDLDQPGHPYLQRDAELDFVSCMQAGEIYPAASNGGGVLSTAAGPTASRDDCITAVEQEPRNGFYVGQGIRAGSVICVRQFDETLGMRVFRVNVVQVSAGTPKTLVIAVVGWR